jgi:hypothetical protein
VVSMTTTGESAGTVTHRRSGAALMSGFALVWALTGASGLPTGGVLVSIVAVGVTALVVLSAFTDDGASGYDGPVAPDWRRRYNRIGIAQAVLIAAVIAGAVALHHPELIPSAVCLVVAAHFVPLAGVFGVPRFLRVAAALGVVAVVGLIVSWSAPEPGRAVTGLGAALTLWWASLPTLRAAKAVVGPTPPDN